MGILGGARRDDHRQAAFRSLFDANHRAVLGYALRRTASASDAADLLSEVLLVAWRRIDEAPSGDAGRLWLYGVARNVLANHRWGRRRQDRLTDRITAEISTVLADPTEGVAERQWVRAALARLGDDDREVLTLTLWEGLTPSEVGVVLGLPAPTVRTRLHRARARMRIELEASTGERSEPAGHERGDGRSPVPDVKEIR